MMNRPHQFPGFLIAIEGIDGAGKTTQAKQLQHGLQSPNLSVALTQEPTSGKWGQVLKDSARTGRLALAEEIETFIKDRQEHVENFINPALAQGQVVIVDRYYFSSMAYQGAGGVDPYEIMWRNEIFAPEPDLLVLLDISPQTGLERIKARGDQANLFEKNATLKKARQIFLSIQKPYLVKVAGRREPVAITDLLIRKFLTSYGNRTN